MIYPENILICIVIPLLLTLLFLSGDTKLFTISFLCGMGACLIAGYISGYFSYRSGMGNNETAVFLSPIVEELLKCLPLVFFLKVFSLQDSSFTMMAAGMGAGFATFENCCYILGSGAESIFYMIVRGMAVGVMHLVSILTFALGLILARRYHALTFPGVVGALALSVTFHALYNLLVSVPGVSTVIGYILPVLSAAVIAYLYRNLRKETQK